MTDVRVASMMKKGVLTAMTKKPKEMKNTSPTAAKKEHLELLFSPTAWAKLLYLRDYADTEVGGFALAPNDELLYVENIRLVRQSCSWASVAFEDESVADFFDIQVDAGRHPEQFARIWVHTHPGDCPLPSMTDEETFDRVFGRSDWAVMFILARNGKSYARLRFNVGPRADVEIPVAIDYSHPFRGCNVRAWEREYTANVRPTDRFGGAAEGQPLLTSPFDEEPGDAWCETWFDYIDDDETVEGFVS
jgi:hypothetical protein